MSARSDSKNLYLYCGIGDHKLDFCSKKQTIVTLKGYSASVATDTSAVAFKKSSKTTCNDLKLELRLQLRQRFEEV